MLLTTGFYYIYMYMYVYWSYIERLCVRRFESSGLHGFPDNGFVVSHFSLVDSLGFFAHSNLDLRISPRAFFLRWLNKFQFLALQACHLSFINFFVSRITHFLSVEVKCILWIIICIALFAWCSIVATSSFNDTDQYFAEMKTFEEISNVSSLDIIYSCIRMLLR